MDFFDLHFVFGCFFPKNLGVFFGCSRFLVLENLENPKKHHVFSGFFRFLLKNPKNIVFFGFSMVVIEKSKTTYWLFGFSKFLLLEIPENPKNLLFFGFSVAFIEKSKKNAFFGFFNKHRKNQQQKNTVFLDV